MDYDKLLIWQKENQEVTLDKRNIDKDKEFVRKKNEQDREFARRCTGITRREVCKYDY